MLLTKTKESQKNEETDRRWDKGDARWGKESCFPPPPLKVMGTQIFFGP